MPKQERQFKCNGMMFYSHIWRNTKPPLPKKKKLKKKSAHHMWNKLSKDQKKNSLETGSCFLSAVNVTFIYIYIYKRIRPSHDWARSESQLIKVLQLWQSNTKNLNKTWFFPFLEKIHLFLLPIYLQSYDNDGRESIEYSNNLAFTQMSRAALRRWVGNSSFPPPSPPKGLGIQWQSKLEIKD